MLANLCYAIAAIFVVLGVLALLHVFAVGLGVVGLFVGAVIFVIVGYFLSGRAGARL